MRKEIFKIPFTIIIKKNKYQGIHLTKGLKDLYIENCKALRNEIKDTMKRYPVFINEKIQELLQRPYYPKQPTDTKQSLSKSNDIFQRNRKHSKIA